MKSSKIINVLPGSIAEKMGIKPGDCILSINGQKLKDIIDFSFAATDEILLVSVKRANGLVESFKIKKKFDESLGVEFESAVFDGIRSCANKCPFCFVEQVPPNMRSSLYIKDDDYRMSFLYGNFITMTNIVDEDIRRIARLHLSPLFISVHTMNMELRANILHTKRGSLLLKQLDDLEEAGIDYHTQIVLCPGLNDGVELDRTLEALIARRPFVQSVAIVPVGLTKYRDNCSLLKMFDSEGAKKVITQVEKYQEQLRKESEETFIYLGDEFYFLAGQELPPTEYYDGFPQLDNGIGLARNFINDWLESKNTIKHNVYKNGGYKLLVVTGEAIAPLFKQLIDQITNKELIVDVLAVKNQFFGDTVNVSGLLTGQDIKNAILKITADNQYDGIILPACALRAGENIFLDDFSLSDLQRSVPCKLITALSGKDLFAAIINWRQVEPLHNNREIYTWQSNAAYTKVRGGNNNE